MKQVNQKSKHQKQTNQWLSLMIAILLIMNIFLPAVNATEKDTPTSEQVSELTENTSVSEKGQTVKEQTETKETQTEIPADSELPSEEGVVSDESSHLKEQATQTEPIADKVANLNNAVEINKAIRNLQYDADEILASKGEEIENKNLPSKEGLHQNEKFIVIERKKKSITTSPVDISVIGSMLDRTYPGALQLANRSLVENRPDLLLAERKPIKISINLPGLKQDNTIVVNEPSYGSVNAAIDTLIDKWNQNYGNSHSIPAQTQYSEVMVYSKSQLSTALNVNADLLEKSLGIDFKAIAKGEKNIMIAAYKQIFYTVNAEMPNKPSDLFADSVTAQDLFDAGMNNDNPPLMVSNVAYGRTIYVKLETSSKSKEVEAAFKALINKVETKGNLAYEEVLKNSSFTAVVLGGDSLKHSEIITNDFEKIRAIVKENSEFGIKNPGYPISYTGTFLKNNAVAVINNLAEYTETTSTEYSKGRITIDHWGGYVAQFEINWDELSYDENGKEVLTPKHWEGNWKSRTAHYNSVLPLPANAKNIRIFARECTGLAWEWWRTIINEKNVPLSGNIRVQIGGTTLYPWAAVKHEK